MTPVIVLSDGYLANASEPWRLPALKELEPFPVNFRTDAKGFQPFARNRETLARDWTVPGTPGLAHRIGGIEREENTGNISYDPDNHQRMTDVRRDRILKIGADIADQTLEVGQAGDDVLVLGWGSTWGPIRSAVEQLRARGLPVASTHLRHIWPLPRNLKTLLSQHRLVLVPEMNDGQLVKLIRAEYLIDAQGINKVKGQPFKISELTAAITGYVAKRKSA